MTCCAEFGELQSVWWVLQRRSRVGGRRLANLVAGICAPTAPVRRLRWCAFVLARQGGALASADRGSGHAIAIQLRMYHKTLVSLTCGADM